MKKNLVIMLMMVLCAGFASAQTVSTVRGFVPGGSTGAMNNDTYATYATFAQPFATMVNNNGHEVTVGLAQMQLVTDSITDVVTCGQGYHKHGFDLTDEELQELLVQCENEGQRGYLRSQKPNVAVQDYYYDSLVVIDLYVCPCTTTVENEEYEVIALNGECWFKENMRNNFEGSMVYTSELNSVDPADPEQLKTFGRLYTYEATISGAEVCEDGEIQGICPEKWHLPTVDEVDPLFTLPAENLRVDGHWIVDGNNNMTEFSAQPAGYYNSISQRFEGMLTETDFWMVDCDNLNPEDNQLPVLQLIYSCNTPLKPNRPKEDAISVRCVYNIVKHLEDCDPMNPEPQPVPPTTQCPTVQIQDAEAMVVPVIIDSYGEIAEHISSVAFSGQVLISNSDNPVTVNDQITDINADGYFVWEYVSPVEVEITSITGNILITLDNNQVCSTSVSKVQEVDNDCPTVTINPTYFDRIEGKIAPYSPNDINNFQIKVSGTFQGLVFNGTANEDTTGQFTDLEVSLLDNIQSDGTFHWQFPTEEYNDVRVMSMSGTITITGPLAECEASVPFNTVQDCSLEVGQPVYSNGTATITINNFSTDYFAGEDSISCGFLFYNQNMNVIRSFNSDNLFNIDAQGVLTATIPSDSIPDGAAYVEFWAQFNIADEYYFCAEDDNVINRDITVPLNNNQDQQTGYTCPESLGSITAPSTTMEYDYYCTINGDAEYIQEIAVTYLYYVPGNTNPDFTLNASNVNVQSGEITFSNPTEDAPQGHSFNNVNHILIQVHVTPVESCGSTPLDQTLNIYLY